VNQGAKRCAPLNCMAHCYWLDPEGNTNSNSSKPNTDQNAHMNTFFIKNNKKIPENAQEQFSTKTHMPYIKITSKSRTS
jgi:hypothetical protein